MNIVEEVESLKKNIKDIYIKRGTIGGIDKNKIYIGRKPSISSEVEEQITLFLSRILSDKYTFYIDCYMYKRRPDVLVVDKDTNKCVLILEIKSCMGYYRELSNEEINSCVDLVNIFKNKDIEAFSRYDTADSNMEYVEGKLANPIRKNNNVKFMFVVLSRASCSEVAHLSNKNRLEKHNLYYYGLFDDWYDNLQDKEIYDFIDNLKFIGLEFRK